jgi:hypothetical protein
MACVLGASRATSSIEANISNALRLQHITKQANRQHNMQAL